MENPALALGWNYKDPVVLESQGQMIVRGIGLLACWRRIL
jgi:hypothetical protein